MESHRRGQGEGDATPVGALAAIRVGTSMRPKHKLPPQPKNQTVARIYALSHRTPCATAALCTQRLVAAIAPSRRRCVAPVP